jgi:hypothetical protein
LRRFSPLVLIAAALASCRIERTPEQYIDNQTSRIDAITAAEAEVQARIVSLAGALERGSAAVDSVLVPRGEFSGVGPDEDEVITDPATFIERMANLAGGRPLSTRHLEVSVAPGIVHAWFLAVYTPVGVEPVDPGFRVSGVLIRDNSGWRLTQGHLSRPSTVTPAP